MYYHKLGSQGLEVSAIGLGCMGLSCAYGPPSEKKQALAVLHRSVDLGVNFWDTAEIYGPYHNEELLGEALKSYSRDKIVIASKFGFDINENHQIVGVTSHPKRVEKALEGSLKRLGCDYIDLYYQHRIDPSIPIEETVGLLAKFVRAGKIKYIGLSEVSADTISRAHAVHPITAIQTEYSLWEGHVEDEILPLTRQLGIGFVAYSPLGRGFLSGQVTSREQLENGDWRSANYPRMSEENFAHNLVLVSKLKEIAQELKVTTAQLALSWILNQDRLIVPIPGTKQMHYLEDNCRAVDLDIPASVWDELDDIVQNFSVAGMRYTAANMTLVDQTS